jgi:hypothetical protein
MDDNRLIFELLKLIGKFVSREERFAILAKALLYVSEEELAAAWADGEFKEVQSRLVGKFENMRRFVGKEPDVELLKWRAERERAIEEGDQGALDQLNEELRRKLEGN